MSVKTTLGIYARYLRVFLRVSNAHVYIYKCSGEGKGNIQFPMRENWLWKVNPNSAKVLALGFIDGHGVCQSDWELASL